MFDKSCAPNKRQSITPVRIKYLCLTQIRSSSPGWDNGVESSLGFSLTEGSVQNHAHPKPDLQVALLLPSPHIDLTHPLYRPLHHPHPTTLPSQHPNAPPQNASPNPFSYS